MPAPLSVDPPRAITAIEEGDLDARLLMLIVAARVTSALEAANDIAESDTKTVIACSGMCTDTKDSERLAPIT